VGSEHRGEKLLERIKDTVGDVVETVRRAFVGPKVYSGLRYFFTEPKCKSQVWPSTVAITASLLPKPSFSALPLSLSVFVDTLKIEIEPGIIQETIEAFSTRVTPTDTIFAWSAKIKATEIPDINLPVTNSIAKKYYGFSTMSHPVSKLAFLQGETYRIITCFGDLRYHRSLERALMIPINIRSEDLTKLSKAILMRYTILLLKESNENIKNIEIIGLYRIPKIGVKKMQYNSTNELLQIIAGTDAQKCTERCKLLLARRKSNATTISCIINEQ
jgi:hypothetical protein